MVWPSPLQTCSICDSCWKAGLWDLPALLLPGDGITRSRIAESSPRERQGNPGRSPSPLHLPGFHQESQVWRTRRSSPGWVWCRGLWGGWRGYCHLLLCSWGSLRALAAPDLLTHGTLVQVASLGTEGPQQHPSAPV